MGHLGKWTMRPRSSASAHSPRSASWSMKLARLAHRSPLCVENIQYRRSFSPHPLAPCPPAGVPVYAEVLEKCPVVRDDYPVYGCFALDALYAEGSKESVAAMEKALTTKDKLRKNVYLGALFRLMNSKGWRTNGQLAQMLPA